MNRPLSTVDAAAICARLADRDIPVQAGVDDRCAVHVWPCRDVTTAEEVAALGAFLSVTDARVLWHRWSEDTIWSRT